MNTGNLIKRKNLKLRTVMEDFGNIVPLKGSVYESKGLIYFFDRRARVWFWKFNFTI